VANCKVCTQEDCIACNLGYTLVGQTCVLNDCSSIQDCDLCNVHTTLECLQCNYGFKLVSKACQKIQCIAGCGQCHDEATCDTCLPAYSKVGNGCLPN
jgi:hypothetical protein